MSKPHNPTHAQGPETITNPTQKTHPQLITHKTKTAAPAAASPIQEVAPNENKQMSYKRDGKQSYKPVRSVRTRPRRRRPLQELAAMWVQGRNEKTTDYDTEFSPCPPQTRRLDSTTPHHLVVFLPNSPQDATLHLLPRLLNSTIPLPLHPSYLLPLRPYPHDLSIISLSLSLFVSSQQRYQHQLLTLPTPQDGMQPQHPQSLHKVLKVWKGGRPLSPLFSLRSAVPPPSVTTSDIYRGAIAIWA